MEEIHIALAAEKVIELFGIPITNTLIMTWIVILFLVVTSYFVGRNLKMFPGKIQIVFESLFETILKYMEDTFENKDLARKFFPLIATIFIFVFASNIIGFTPGVGSVGFFQQHDGKEEFISLLRPVNTDLNATLALAIISFVTIEITGVFILGFLKYFRKFVNFKSVLGFFIGIIELFSEIARLIAFSFRLFGNIFAGKVLIIVIMFFVPFILPVPLMVFEVFVAFMQAAIFSLLTLFFIKLAITEMH